MIYVASPYSHTDFRVQHLRYKQVADFCHQRVNEGDLVISPIAHWHYIAMNHHIDGDWKTWKEYNSQLISYCREMWVLMLEGWEDSIGVRAELDLAEEHDIPVRFFDYVPWRSI